MPVMSSWEPRLEDEFIVSDMIQYRGIMYWQCRKCGEWVSTVEGEPHIAGKRIECEMNLLQKFKRWVI